MVSGKGVSHGLLRLGLCAALAGACAPASGVPRPASLAPHAAAGTEPAPSAARSPAAGAGQAAAAAVDRVLAGMTPEEKVGQLMVVSFAESSATPAVTRMVRDYHVGGVILFQQNLRDADQVRTLTSDLQAAARVPLLIGVDQEGGPVVRVTRDVTLFPSPMAIGATGAPETAAAVAGAAAQQLRALGINTNFAPDVDVNSNPRNPVIGVRSYGGDPSLVGRLATAAIGATQQAGVLAVAKHFPGHGDAEVDSHEALPLIDRTMAQLQATELPPFRAAVAAGVDAIMTAHVLMPALEPERRLPATLSPAVLGYLRETLGFDGVIVTDDLEMGAIVDGYGTAEAARLAFEAGADLLLFRRDVAAQEQAYALLLDAVRRGEITPERLDRSVRRILTAKARRGVLGALAASEASAASGVTMPSGPHGIGEASEAPGDAVALDAARRSVTLVKNAGGLLPLGSPGAPGREGGPTCVVYPSPLAVAGVEIAAPSRPGEPQTLGEAVAAVHPGARVAAVEFRPTREEAAAAWECAAGAKALILGTYNLADYPAQAALMEQLVATGTPAVVVALRLPYDLTGLGRAAGLMAAYSNRPASLRAVAEALYGVGHAPSGHLPVALDGGWPLGFGLLDYGRSR